MNQANDFVIQDGILLEYRGNDRVVRVPEGVRGISVSAFRFRQPEEVYLPEGLEWLADTAFWDMPPLRRLVLPGTLRIVPDELCRHSESLEEVVIPEGVVRLGNNAFEESGLTRVTIPDSVRSIGKSCFAKCARLENVSLGRGVQLLEGSAFAFCESLQTISLPASLRSIESWAFHQCASLRSVRVEPGAEGLSVGSFVFDSCPRLKEIPFPDTLEDIQGDAFGNEPTVERVAFQGNRVRIDDTSPFMGNVCLCPVIRAPRMLPEWIPVASRPAALSGYRELKAEGYPLEPGIAEAWETFAAGADPDSPENPAEPFSIVDGVLWAAACPDGRVVVPEGVIGVRREAFANTAVREVWLPDTVVWIHPEAFQYCKELQAVRLPAGLTRIPAYLFHGCGNLKSIRLPDSVKYIGDSAFADTGLETITLPPSLKTIEPNAFRGCRQLKQVLFPEGLREIRWEAFANCRSLTEVSLPDSLDHLGENVFHSCTALQRVRLGTRLNHLAESVFHNCSSLQEVVSSMGPCTLLDDCFAACPETLRFRMEASFVELAYGGLPSRIIAPNADPTILNEESLRPLLLGFVSEDGKGFRYEAKYLNLLRLRRREVWDSEPVLRFLLAHDMLEREDIPDCLELLQDREDHDLVAEVLEYSHRRFPEPGAPLLLE